MGKRKIFTTRAESFVSSSEMEWDRIDRTIFMFFIVPSIIVMSFALKGGDRHKVIDEFIQQEFNEKRENFPCYTCKFINIQIFLRNSLITSQICCGNKVIDSLTVEAASSLDCCYPVDAHTSTRNIDN